MVNLLRYSPDPFASGEQSYGTIGFQNLPVPISVTRMPQEPRRWWILATVALAQLMVVLDATIVNIAMPSAQHDLGFSDNDRQWIVTAYALAFGSLLLLGGRLSDLIGRRTTFIIGLVGFAEIGRAHV